MNTNEHKDSNIKKPNISVKETSNYNQNAKPDETSKQNKSDLPLEQINGLLVGSLLRVWTEVSKINYLSSQPLSVITNGQSIRRRSIGLLSTDRSIERFVSSQLRNKSIEDLFAEQFPINVTPLLNEDQLWGCFYNFPELYADEYSPVVAIRDAGDVPQPGGELTRDMVTPCLTYLKRTPIMGDYVYIKLDLSSKHLTNIDVLQHYKYLVYLDLSSNLLTQLTVLSHLPYLQFLSVAFNRLSTILEYDTPQWFLTEVHYKFNSVKRIRDLSAFWSITILDLSHNNIKGISGLESLRYLRRLDLSFNHIQRLENLNHLRLLWLDVSYNNISSFEFGPQAGLWTLLHLEYLNVNENNLTSMKMFSGCTRLRELHARNNSFSMLLELAVYMRRMRRLIILDLRANPLCSTPGYRDVVVNTLPMLLSLDAEQLDPVEQQTIRMEMTPDIGMFASRRLLRLLYVEQLCRARVSPHVPPADTTEVPIVVLVGYEGIGKGTIARRLVAECSSNITLAVQHTTAPYHTPGHYKEVSREKFDDMVLAGEFLTYTEMDGESYGLSREEGFIKDGKVRVVCMDLISALMLRLRGRRPFMILCTCSNDKKLIRTQQLRKAARNAANEQRHSLEAPMERSTLQVMLSGRIIITGILNEILMCLPEEKEKSEFVIESECSLMMDSEAREAMQEFTKGVNLLAYLNASATSFEEACKRAQEKSSQLNPSLFSLYKGSLGTADYNSCAYGPNSIQERKSKKFSSEIPQAQKTKEKPSSLYRPKSVDFSRYASSTWKGRLSMVPDGSKSVTFTATDGEYTDIDPTGSPLEPPNQPTGKDPGKNIYVDDRDPGIRSMSPRMPWQSRGQPRVGSHASIDDTDLWHAFLTETGILQANNMNLLLDQTPRHKTIDTEVDPDVIIQEMDFYNKTSFETVKTTIRDGYEGIHRLCPGLFWDTVMTDNHDEAFLKVKNIIRDIVNSQKNLKPMYDINFTNLENYPTVEKRLTNIHEQIASQRLFY